MNRVHQQNESLVAFGKALFDHVANPQYATIEKVRMKQDAWIKVTQEAQEDANKRKTMYEELHNAPRQHVAQLYDQYLQAKQAAYQQYLQTKSDRDRRKWLSIPVPAELQEKGVNHDFVFTTDRLFNKSDV